MKSYYSLGERYYCDRITEGAIACCLAQNFDGFDNAVGLIQNDTSFLGYEADLIRINNHFETIDEIEIKISVADFRAEFVNPKLSKIRKHQMLLSPESKVSRYYLATTEEVYAQVKDMIPPYAGVYVVYPNKDKIGTYILPSLRDDCRFAYRLDKYYLTLRDQVKLTQLLNIRYWQYKINGHAGRP